MSDHGGNADVRLQMSVPRRGSAQPGTASVGSGGVLPDGPPPLPHLQMRVPRTERPDDLPWEVRRAQERERLRNASQDVTPQAPAILPPLPPSSAPPVSDLSGETSGVRPAYVQAFQLLRAQRPRPQIVGELQKSGVDTATASEIVAKVGDVIAVMRAAARKAGLKAAAIGAAWGIGGTLVTAVTYAAASSGSGGGTYFVAWGAVLFGGIQAIRGLIVAARQPTEQEILALVGF